MQRKVFLQKNKKSQAVSQGYLKYFLWAGLGLFVLVLAFPFFIRQKGEKVTAQKPVSQKGMVVKEIPKSGMVVARKGLENEGLERKAGKAVAEGRATTGEKTDPRSGAQGPTGTALQEKSEPGPDKVHLAQVGQKEIQQTPAAPGQNQPGLPAPAVQKPNPSQAVQPKPKPKDLALASSSAKTPKPTPTAASPAASQPQAAPAAAGKPAESGSWMYTVQVGSYRDRQNAEEVQEKLKKKGYSVVLKIDNHPKLGKLYVVQLLPVKDAGEAGGLKEKIKKETSVEPLVVKIPSRQ